MELIGLGDFEVIGFDYVFVFEVNEDFLVFDMIICLEINLCLFVVEVIVIGDVGGKDYLFVDSIGYYVVWVICGVFVLIVDGDFFLDLECLELFFLGRVFFFFGEIMLGVFVDVKIDIEFELILILDY